MITGLTLIFERLFLIQQKQGESPEPDERVNPEGSQQISNEPGEKADE
jgi:hypothetical protein